MSTSVLSPSTSVPNVVIVPPSSGGGTATNAVISPPGIPPQGMVQTNPQLMAPTVGTPPSSAAVMYPSAPVAGTPLYVSQSLPPLVYSSDETTDPAVRPLLPDYTGGWITLDGEFPSSNAHKPTMVVDRIPRAPFWPTTIPGNIQYTSTQLGAMMAFVYNFRPHILNPNLPVYAQGYTRLPHDAPVYVPVNGMGVCIAVYWRWSKIAIVSGLPATLMFVVWRLTPLPVSSASPDAFYVGKLCEVPSTWCKPMKMAISQFPTSNSPDPINVTFVVDDGTEFRLPLDVVRTNYRTDLRMRIAVNAMLRDFPWMESVFAYVPQQPPLEYQVMVQRYAQQVLQNQGIFAGQGVRVVPTVRGLPGQSLPGSNVIVAVPMSQAAAPAAAAEQPGKEEEKTEEEEEKEPMETKTKPATAHIRGRLRTRPQAHVDEGGHWY
jgi:ribosomal protein L12E/L44/L45/RPP1/RPP2